MALIAEVIAMYGRHLLLRDSSGMHRKARPVGRHLEIVCGDRVQCRVEGDELLAESILARDSFLRRSTLRGRSEPLAANLSQLAVIVAPFLRQTCSWSTAISAPPPARPCTQSSC